MNILLLMMGGSGTRLGANVPKQYIELENRPIFSYILEAHQNCEAIDKIVIVSHEDWIEYVSAWSSWLCADKVAAITKGGPNRSTSVKNGLLAMESFASRNDVILIHDATHPYCDKNGIVKIIDAVNEFGGATLGQAQYDTVYGTTEEEFIERVVPRQRVVSGASPEAFRYGDICDIYKNADEAELEAMTSAGAIAMAHDIPMKVIHSEVLNLKITYPGDLHLLTLLLHDFFPERKPCSPEEKPI